MQSFVLAYSPFTGAILGVMLADFFLLRKQRLAVTTLYETTGPFSYSYGVDFD